MYSLLPPVTPDKYLELPYFPSRFHAAVFRLWETVPAQRIAKALDATVSDICQAADEMGLPEQSVSPLWDQRGYITTIRNAWHILPYDQLLTVLDWTEEQLATALKEEDFLFVKLGFTKPYCPRVAREPLTAQGQQQLQSIRDLMRSQFPDLFQGAEPFCFFPEVSAEAGPASDDSSIRMIYSYCGLYANVLEQDISLSYPDALLQQYQKGGVNAIWLPAVLYQLTPFPFDPHYSEGWEMRQQRLRELIDKAKVYGIQVFLYLNEPRCMPLPFFEEFPQLKGAVHDQYAALCTSRPEVIEYLRSSVTKLCQDVPGLGGFFTITCSENLTHCKSRSEASECPNCHDRSVGEMVSQVLRCIYEASTSVDPKIRTIAWTWAWDDYMTETEITNCIASLPKEIIIQCNSEAKKAFTIGGIDGFVRDYSMSIPGPSDYAKSIWDCARKTGHSCSAKVQVNVTWECSTLPFLPVFDLIREHMTNLRSAGVEHLMLSWTLGGYPSINLKIANQCYQDPAPDKYHALLADEFGEYAQAVEQAAKIFSDAFRDFPFHIDMLYLGPQNGGPSNLLFAEPSGFPATMTCYAFDDLDAWRAIYPREVLIDQLRMLSELWAKGLELIRDMPQCTFKQAAYGGYALFRASYLQASFIIARNAGDSQTMAAIIPEESELAILMYRLMSESPLFGYEAANHYYFTKGMLAEKVLNCAYLQEYLST